MKNNEPIAVVINTTMDYERYSIVLIYPGAPLIPDQYSVPEDPIVFRGHFSKKETALDVAVEINERRSP